MPTLLKSLLLWLIKCFSRKTPIKAERRPHLVDIWSTVCIFVFITQRVKKTSSHDTEVDKSQTLLQLTTLYVADWKKHGGFQWDPLPSEGLCLWVCFRLCTTDFCVQFREWVQPGVFGKVDRQTIALSSCLWKSFDFFLYFFLSSCTFH